MATDLPTGRPTPFERVFGDERFTRVVFPEILEEAESRRLSVDRRDRFALLRGVAELLDSIVPAELEAAALDTYLDTVFHAFHFWRAGQRVYAFEHPVVESLVEEPPDPIDASPPLPAPAVYIELPARLFWGLVSGRGAPEPAEGLFVRSASTGPGGVVEVLLVMGMWPDRPGFSTVSLRGAVDPGDEAPAERADFRSDIPGAELAGLYSLRTPTEVMTLLRRLLWYLSRYPRAIDVVVGSSPESGEGTTLDHYRVRPVERRPR